MDVADILLLGYTLTWIGVLALLMVLILYISRYFARNQSIDNCFQSFKVREHFCCDNESMFTTADTSYVVPTCLG